MPSFKGFQTVETKSMKRDKNKARSEEYDNEFSTTAAAWREQPEAKTKTEQEKAKRLPGENPIDPRVEKERLKQAKSLQKNYANQTAGTGANRPSPSAAPAQKQKVETVDLGAWGSTTRPANAQTSIIIPSHASHGGGWGASNGSDVKKTRGTGALNDANNFVALPSAGPDVQDDKRYFGPPKSTPSLKEANKKKAAEPSHTAHTLVVGKKVAPKQSSASANTDEAAAESCSAAATAADGAALPISVAAIMLTADGKAKEIPLSGSLDKMATKVEQFIGGMPKNANAVANLPIRGGLFMTVGGKKFSDASTIFEPWMVESYYKALTSLIEGDEHVNAHGAAVAHPYWPVTANGQHDTNAAEADVTMRIIRANPSDNLFAPTTLIELEHVTAHATVKVQLRKVHASFKSFANGMLRAGEQFVCFREVLEDALEVSPLKGAAAAEITKKFAGKFNSSLAKFKAALEKATAGAQ